MDAFVIDRADGRDDGEDWTESYEKLPGGADISIILESTSKAGVGPRLHQHPYAETFLIRRGSATFRRSAITDELEGHAGQILDRPRADPGQFLHRARWLPGGAHPRELAVRRGIARMIGPRAAWENLVRGWTITSDLIMKAAAFDPTIREGHARRHVVVAWSRSAISAGVSVNDSAPALWVACSAFFAPGMGSTPSCSRSHRSAT